MVQSICFGISATCVGRPERCKLFFCTIHAICRCKIESFSDARMMHLPLCTGAFSLSRAKLRANNNLMTRMRMMISI